MRTAKIANDVSDFRKRGLIKGNEVYKSAMKRERRGNLKMIVLKLRLRKI